MRDAMLAQRVAAIRHALRPAACRNAAELGGALRRPIHASPGHARTAGSAVIFRDHVGRVLADPSDGYFSANADMVGKLAEPFNFKTIVGNAGWVMIGEPTRTRTWHAR